MHRYTEFCDSGVENEDFAGHHIDYFVNVTAHRSTGKIGLFILIVKSEVITVSESSQTASSRNGFKYIRYAKLSSAE
jgi:hypothetical protein